MKRVFSSGATMMDPPCKATPEQPVTAFYLHDKYSTFERAYAYPKNASREHLADWRNNLKQELKKVFTLDVLGEIPLPEYHVLRSERGEGYTRKLIAYEVTQGNWVQAYLLIPYTTPAPAALCLHGHFVGAKDSVVFPKLAAGKAYGHELARRGFVVLAPDGAGMAAQNQWGTNKRDVPPDYMTASRVGGCDLLFRRLNHMGIDLTGFRLFESMAAIHMLLAMPFVRGQEVACLGLSGGCWLTQIMTALDERIKASVMSGYFTTFVQTAWLGHCVCHHPFGIGRLCDMPDISALAAPKPQFVEAGSEDSNYPVEPAFSMCMDAYKDLQAEDRFQLHRFEGGHRFDGEQSIPWLCEQFGMTSS